MNKLFKSILAIVLCASTTLVASANNLDHLTPAQKNQYAKERKEYSTICKTPVPKTNNKCNDEKANLARLKQCLALREAFGKKWFNDNDEGHNIENQNTQTAINKKEKWIKDNCK